VAFFLRANSKLYTSVQSRLIQFAFFDLLIPLEHHLTQLNDLQPTIVVGQPSLLMMLVEAQQQGMMHIAPQKIISVAEVLSDEDEAALKACFQVPVQQVYQCNEGMFGQTCSQGNFHLNEDGLLIEKEWLDATRFQPIITDMRRKVQPVIRYKMNDILHATECTCGSKMIAVSQIEGRTDDVLHFPGGKRVFPDFIRRTVIGAHPTISNYQIIQEGSDQLSLYVQPLDQWECAKDALGRLFEDHNIQGVSLLQLTEKRHILGTKFRRIHAQRS
jgi:putative adenylate-forming enzyme